MNTKQILLELEEEFKKDPSFKDMGVYKYNTVLSLEAAKLTLWSIIKLYIEKFADKVSKQVDDAFKEP